jgi:hypothetical protein
LIVECRKSLFAIFRSVDKEDLGVVSFDEAIQIFKNVNLQLKPHEIEDLRSELDPLNNGLVIFLKLRLNIKDSQLLEVRLFLDSSSKTRWISKLKIKMKNF